MAEKVSYGETAGQEIESRMSSQNRNVPFVDNTLLRKEVFDGRAFNDEQERAWAVSGDGGDAGGSDVIGIGDSIWGTPDHDATDWHLTPQAEPPAHRLRL